MNLLGQSEYVQQASSTAETLLQKAEELQKRSESVKAIELIEEAQVLYQEEKNWEAYVESVIKIFDYSATYQEATTRLTIIDQAIQNAQKYLSANHQLEVEALWKKAELYLGLGKFKEADLVLREAIRKGQKGEHWGALSWAFVMQAVSAYYQTDFQTMETSLDTAQLLAETKIDNPQSHSATIVQLQAILYDATGDFEKSFVASTKNLARYRARIHSNKTDSLELANAYNNHGAVCYERGDYDQAIYHYKIALAIKKELASVGDEKALIEINNNIATAYKRKTNWKATQDYLKASQALLPKEVTDDNYKVWIQTYQSLAANYIDQEDFQNAIPLLEKLLPIGNQYKSQLYWIHGSYGRGLLDLHKNESARLYLRKAEKEAMQKLGTKHPKVARMTRLIGDSYLAEDSLSIALKYYQKALYALAPNFEDTLGISNPKLETITALIEFLPCLASKAKVLTRLAQEDQQWLTASLKTYRLAVATIDEMRANHETDEAKLLLSNSAKSIYEAAIKVLHQRYEESGEDKFLAQAFQYAEKSKSILLLEMIRSSRAREKINPTYANDTIFYSLLESGRKIKNEILFFEQKTPKSPGEKSTSDQLKLKNAEAALARLYQEDLAWKAKLKSLYPAYYDLQYDESVVDIKTTQQKLLDENTALVEYFIGENTSFVFLIKAEEVQFLKLDHHQDLAVAKKHFQDLLTDPSSIHKNAKAAYTNYNQAAYRLYQIVLEKLMPSLSSNIKKLIIVPDGTLNSVPFEALNTEIMEVANIDFGKLPYLLYRFPIHYAYSSTLLLSNRTRYEQLAPNIECLAFAPPYPEIQAMSRGRLQNLRNSDATLIGAVSEIQQIALYFSGEFDFSTSATEASFKEKASDFGILHLAMHGVTDFENPNFAHLKFASATKDNLEDNRLHHYEIAELNLKSQLAVLSACETGLGKYEEGEGVFSLARSFMYAGVPSVLMSLWKIDDQSTGKLMPLFYERLSKQMTKDLALQDAKVTFLKMADIEYRHPFYWSGMVLLGEAQALKRKDFSLWWNLLLLPLAALIGFFLWKRFYKSAT